MGTVNDQRRAFDWIPTETLKALLKNREGFVVAHRVNAPAAAATPEKHSRVNGKRKSVCALASLSADDEMTDVLSAFDAHVVMRLLKKAKKEHIAALCGDFGVRISGNKQNLAQDLAQQLHYETDDTQDEDEDENEYEEEVATYATALRPGGGHVNDRVERSAVYNDATAKSGIPAGVV